MPYNFSLNRSFNSEYENFNVLRVMNRQKIARVEENPSKNPVHDKTDTHTCILRSNITNISELTHPTLIGATHSVTEQADAFGNPSFT